MIFVLKDGKTVSTDKQMLRPGAAGSHDRRIKVKRLLNAQSLKTVIAVNIALLLLIVVILIDFVFVSTTQNDYLTKKKQDCRVVALSVQNILYPDHEADLSPPSAQDEDYFRTIATINDINAMLIVDNDGSPLFIQNIDGDAELHRILVNGAARAIVSEQTGTYLHDKVWGVFFIRNHYLIVVTPIGLTGKRKPAAVGSAVDLSPFYARQRKNQLIILFYTLINILLLMILGTYAISRATIRPINTLVKRAEERQKDEHLGFFYAPGKNEFRRLSASLNRMLDRIEGDKRRLEGSLVRLEEANQEIKDRQNELIRAEKLASVGRLSAGIAHEIGNPIGIVLGYLDMLRHQDLSESEKTDYIIRCETEIQKINRIIRELLDFSRPSNKTAAETVGIHALIKETMDLLSVQPVMRDIEKTYDFRADDDKIAVVPDKMRQVFVNLILNAADAIAAARSADGEIFICTSTPPSPTGQAKLLRIDIHDNGAGISEEDLETIFDPFFTTKDPGQGTGLGLYVCYMILDNMGGAISIVSRRGEGTTVTVHLPLENQVRPNEA